VLPARPSRADVASTIGKCLILPRVDRLLVARQLPLRLCAQKRSCRGAPVIKIIGAAVLVLAFAISAQAQSAHGDAPHFTASISTRVEGSAGGGGSIGSGAGQLLPHFPQTRFAARAVTGDASDYIPSTFLSYQAALAEGKASLSARAGPLALSAHTSGQPAQHDAKIDVVQRQDGKPAIKVR
jgi:hypothetical protein